MSRSIKLIAGLGIVAIAAFAALLLVPQRTAPEARFATLSGENFITSELRGKVTAVNFWATSCSECIAEMPKMVESYRKFAPRGYEVVAVAMSHDHPNRVADFTQRRALPFKVALDSTGEIAQRFGNIHITPTTFVIDKKGRILKRYVGEPQWAEFERLIEAALAEPA